MLVYAIKYSIENILAQSTLIIFLSFIIIPSVTVLSVFLLNSMDFIGYFAISLLVASLLAIYLIIINAFKVKLIVDNTKSLT